MVLAAPGMGAMLRLAAGGVTAGRIRSAAAIGDRDWRNLLLAGGVGNTGWELVVDRELGAL